MYVVSTYSTTDNELKFSPIAGVVSDASIIMDRMTDAQRVGSLS